jgi:glycosyltransferase involved in cell wall biosynthesis
VRIAIFTDTFLPATNGVVTATVALANSLVKKGHTVVIVTPTIPSTKRTIDPCVQIIRVASIPARFYPGYRFATPYSVAVIKRLRKERIEVIHFMTPASLGLFAIIAALQLDVPLIGTFHTFIAEREYLKHVRLDYDLFERITWKYTAWQYNRCELVTVPAPSTKCTLRKHGCTAPIDIISNGIDTSGFSASPSKTILRTYQDRTLVLYVGRISNEKNILALIRSFVMSTRRDPSLVLLIVGDGPQMNEAKVLVRSLRAQQAVVFLGRIPNQRLLQSGLFRACDFFASASCTENQPMTVLEALSQGLPVIARNARGMPDIVKDGKNGLLVRSTREDDFSEAITELASNTALRKRLARGAIASVHKHHMEKVVETWERTYERVVARHVRKKVQTSAHK